MGKFGKIIQDYKNGRMNIEDIGWLIEELAESKERITELEGTSQRLMDISIQDSDKLKKADERIKELEAQGHGV